MLELIIPVLNWRSLRREADFRSISVLNDDWMIL